MTLSRLHISVFLGLAAAVWGGALLVKGTPITLDHIAPFGTVVSFLVLLSLSFEHVLWRCSWLHGWFVQRPNLRGTWRVELQSDWRSAGSDEPTPMIECYMGVEQTLSKLQMHLMTPESNSTLIAKQIRPSPSGTGYQIVGVYTNKPQMHLRGDRSEIHYGTLLLDTHGPESRPNSLTGEYWTERKTTGRLTFTERVDEVFTRYIDADKKFRSHGSLNTQATSIVESAESS